MYSRFAVITSITAVLVTGCGDSVDKVKLAEYENCLEVKSREWVSLQIYDDGDSLFNPEITSRYTATEWIQEECAEFKP
jgi:hypothetical protein